MRGLIKLLTVVTVGFAGYTFWVDPTTGPIIQAYVPESVMDLIPEGMPSIAASNNTELGGMGIADRVTGSVADAVNN